MDLSGVLPVFQTPFTADESIDLVALRRELDWLLELGSAGVVMAMVSETLRLSNRERDDLGAAVCEHVAGRGTVILSVGAESTRTAVEHARLAQRSGATAVMATPPVATALGEAQLLSYYRQIIEAVDLPVIVQDASGYVGRPIPIAAQAGLMREFGPQKVLFKPEAVPLGPRLSQLRDATDGQARVFEGSGGIALVDSFRRGIVGTMPGADLVWAIVPLWEALQRGDWPRVNAISLPLSALVALQTGLDGFLAVEKFLLVKQGVFANAIVRGPVGFELDGETQAEVERLFDLLKVAVTETTGVGSSSQ